MRIPPFSRETALLFLAMTVFLNCPLESQNLPKREFRGAWIATVTNLDWPTSTQLDVATQQTQLITLLDSLSNAGINSVLFQIRPECDALYASPYEPWSYWLTGTQGRTPLPYYDPLELAVSEAHKRGMELHAWFNPYRSVRVIGSYTVSGIHVSEVHPAWNIAIGSFKFLDPGLQAVRDYVAMIVTDVVRRYDLDGVHFDDYFYPYSGITNQDDATFATYPRGFSDRAAWRRDNVNLLVAQVYDSIQAVKPYVKFGISPFGIWRTGYPSTAVRTLSAYDDIYCDAIAWLQNKTIDYLTPQLYWGIGSQTSPSSPRNTDYSLLMPWWADSVAANGRHFYPGHIFGASYSNAELPNQVALNRANPKTGGSVFFRASFLRGNDFGFADSLKRNLYRHPALPPSMGWKDTLVPNPPLNARYERTGLAGPASLVWDVPPTAADDDSASRYVVYRFTTASPVQADYDNSSHILSVAGSRATTPSIPDPPGTYYYSVSALDRNWNESVPTSIVAVSPPPVPILASFPDSALDVPPQVALTWNSSTLASSYVLQVDEDPGFAAPLSFQTGTSDTTYIAGGFEGQKRYHWRVRAGNAGGYSSFSPGWSFTTGFPATTIPAIPENYMSNVGPVNPLFAWHSSAAADSYRFQLAASYDFLAMVLDTSGITDTTITALNLQGNKIYSWRVAGTNAIGTSLWSQIFQFRTAPISLVEGTGPAPSFGLEQNYPNPFNASTQVRFALAEAGMTRLAVYDMLGREVAVLVEAEKNAGIHTVRFQTADLPSGVYFYVLTSGNFRQARKMLLLR